jgi:zinc protease
MNVTLPTVAASDPPSIPGISTTGGFEFQVEDHGPPAGRDGQHLVRVGAANERPGLTGFAHLFEHMMFAGTRHIPRGWPSGCSRRRRHRLERDHELRSHQLLRHDAGQPLALNLWTHADRMDTCSTRSTRRRSPTSRTSCATSCGKTTITALRRRRSGALSPAVSQGHPYRGAVIGTHADVQSAKLDDLKRFFKLYYAPNNASLVIAGDIDKAAARSWSRVLRFVQAGPVPRVNVVTPPITAEHAP